MRLPRSRFLILSAVLGTGLLGTAGCASMVASRTIEQFTASLESGDFQSLQALTTSQFANAALPDESSLGTFELVGLPSGEIEVEEVEEISDTRQRVTATIGTPPQTLVYDLSRPSGSGDWKVDEITMKRGRGRAEVTRTVTEQMELLLAVREIVRGWQRDDLTAALDATEDTLADPLRQLPEAWRTQIAEEFFGNVLPGAPKAKLVDGQARIDLSHKTGRLRLLLGRDADSRWALRTAVLTEGRDEKTSRDLRTEADVLGVTGRFLTALANDDPTAAAEYATDSFAANALHGIDLTSVDMPLARMTDAAYSLRQEPTRTEVSVTVPEAAGDTAGSDEATYQITVRTSRPGDETDITPRVEEVTTFAGDSIVRLSADLNLEPTVRFFHAALLAGDVDRMRTRSIKAIDNELWRHWVEAAGVSGRNDLFARIDLVPLPRRSPEVTWDGPTMRATFADGDRRITYKLRSAGQQVLVEDIEIVESQRDLPRSIRRELATLLAMDEMADGLITGDVLLIRRASTPELSSMVWELQAPEDLPAELDLLPLVRSLPKTITATPLDTLVEVDGGTVVMRDDGGRLKIDDVIYYGEHGQETGRFANRVRRSRTVQAKANSQMTTR